MKIRATPPLLLLFLILVGGLAWIFWPAEKAASTQMSGKSTPTVATTPTNVVVEAPRMPAVQASGGPVTDEYGRPLTPALVAGMAQTTTVSPLPPLSDLGEVAVTDGVPIIRTLVTGEKCTITPHFDDNGAMTFIRLEMQVALKSGLVLAVPEINVKSGGSAVYNAPPSGNFNGINLQITPHLEGGSPLRANPPRFVINLSFDAQRQLLTPMPPPPNPTAANQ
jgi:hypothetical protein